MVTISSARFEFEDIIRLFYFVLNFLINLQNRLFLVGAIVLLHLTGCNATQNRPIASSPSNSSPSNSAPEAIPVPPSSSPPTETPILQIPGDAAPAGASAETPVRQIPDDNAPSELSTEASETRSIVRDYDFSTPLPSTGKVTVRDSIRNLDLDRLITNCPENSAPYAYAESTRYRIQICSQEYDPWLPKYYIGQAKDGSGELRTTSTNPDEARQLIFKQEGYTYILYRDGARPEAINAYL